MADIPILFSKTKLKSLNFATNITTIFKNFDESEEKNLDLIKSIQLTNNFQTDKENKNTETKSIKRQREESDSEVEKRPNKILKDVPKETSKNEENSKKAKKSTFVDNNYRRLNMKTFGGGGGAKGYRGGTSKGTKFKRFQWAKNKNKNKMNAKYGVGTKNDEDENEPVNYNLLCDETEVKPVEVVEEVMDEMSAEAQFAKLKKPEDTKKSILKKEKLIKNNKKNNLNKSDEDESSDEKDIKAKSKKTSEHKKETKKKSPKKKISNEEKEGETCEPKSAKKKSAKKKKVIDSEDNDDETEQSEPKSSKKQSNKNSKKLDYDADDDFCKQIIDEDQDDEINELTPENCDELSQPKPIFSVDENGHVPSRLPGYAYKILEKDFGHKNFKDNQEEAIIRIACGQSALAILSTGYGKSLIYQFAALLYARKYPGSLVLVVSPLISLMQDQLHNLTKSLKAAACESTMSEKEFEMLVQDIQKGKINILYMSPEAIINKKIKSLPRLAFVCIDEVHCLSQWSHNFRPSYLQLCQVLFDFYKAQCILGLTATATDSSIEEIRSYFDIDKRNIIKDCDLPENLTISISQDNNKEQALVELLKSQEFKPFFDHVIIYCSRREQTERLAQLLRLSLHSYKKSFDLEKYSKMERKTKESEKELKKAKKEDELNDNNIAESYHAGLSAQQRKRIQNQFIKGKLKIIVATLAFGMGINMPNIRAVIHYNMPKSIENYVQEIGRAGRDGKVSVCHLFLENQREDINEIKKYIHMNGYDQLTIKKLLMKIFDTCSPDKCCESQEFKHHVALPISDMVDFLDIKEETILTLLCYLEAAKYLKIMSNCFKTCTIKSYKGIDYLKQLAKTNEFVALIFDQNKKSNSKMNDDEIRVDLIDLCEATGGEYEFIRQKLRRLEWQLDEMGNYKSKSGIHLEFGNQSFYVKRKCIMQDSELDDLNDMLWNRVDSQMKFSYANFTSLYKMLNEKSYKNIGQYIYNFDLKSSDEKQLSKKQVQSEDEDSDSGGKLQLEPDSDSEETKEENYDVNSDERDEENRVTFKSKLLKQKLNEYFNNKFDIQDYARDYSFNCENGVSSLSREQDMKRLIADIKKFIFTYQSDVKLNGSIIARIFHGIGTPRFPAEIWGRNRLFWRCHLDFDFEQIVKIATEQLINL